MGRIGCKCAESDIKTLLNDITNGIEMKIKVDISKSPEEAVRELNNYKKILIKWLFLESDFKDEELLKSFKVIYNIISEIDRITSDIISNNYDLYINLFSYDDMNYQESGNYLHNCKYISERLHEEKAEGNLITVSVLKGDIMPRMNKMASYVIKVCDYLEGNIYLC